MIFEFLKICSFQLTPPYQETRNPHPKNIIKNKIGRETERERGSVLLMNLSAQIQKTPVMKMRAIRCNIEKPRGAFWISAEYPSSMPHRPPVFKFRYPLSLSLAKQHNLTTMPKKGHVTQKFPNGKTRHTVEHGPRSLNR